MRVGEERCRGTCPVGKGFVNDVALSCHGLSSIANCVSIFVGEPSRKEASMGNSNVEGHYVDAVKAIIRQYRRRPSVLPRRVAMQASCK